jgi:tRNA splicing ligase
MCSFPRSSSLTKAAGFTVQKLCGQKKVKKLQKYLGTFSADGSLSNYLYLMIPGRGIFVIAGGLDDCS